MVADRDGARKPTRARSDLNCSTKFPQMTPLRSLVARGLAQINLEVKQSVICFEGHDIRNVQAGVI